MLVILRIDVDAGGFRGGGAETVESRVERVDVGGVSHVDGENALRSLLQFWEMKMPFDIPAVRIEFHVALVAVAFSQRLEELNVGATLHGDVVIFLPGRLSVIDYRCEMIVI